MLRGIALLGLVACGDQAGARAADAADRIDAAPDVLDAPAIDAAPDGPAGLPDLQFLASDMHNYVVMSQNIPDDDCAVKEACVSGTGVRQLLRFKTVTVNRGNGDFIVGIPPPPEMSDATFEWSPCHKHHHLRGYTLYQLVNETGVVITGRKQSFCISDNKQIDPGVPFPHYQCTNQGLSRGWADVYDLDVACQWIDVTDVAPGAYTLRLVVNPENKFPDSDLTNNVFTLPVNL